MRVSLKLETQGVQIIAMHERNILCPHAFTQQGLKRAGKFSFAAVVNDRFGMIVFEIFAELRKLDRND